MNRQEKIHGILHRGVAEIIDLEHLRQSLGSGKKLRVKYGIDPTALTIHLGHAVPIRKLKAFQELGHQVVIIIGDYTAQIGDPSGRDKTRSLLSRERVKQNAQTYLQQLFLILDRRKTEVHFQSEWYREFTLAEVIPLASQATLAQFLTHETFKKRLDNKQPLSLLELFYPLLQGYDSIAVRADVEIGGTDQKFNLLMGRHLQRNAGFQPQDIVMLRLLTGRDGSKMGKSLNNYVALLDAPDEMYGKIMSIPDTQIQEYSELCTALPWKEMGKSLAQGVNPRDVKAQLAQEIVNLYHGQAKARQAAQEFARIFQHQERPTAIKRVKIGKKKVTVTALLVAAKLATSKSEARRLVEQGGVKINNQTIADWQWEVAVTPGAIIQVGRRKFVEVI